MPEPISEEKPTSTDTGAPKNDSTDTDNDAAKNGESSGNGETDSKETDWEAEAKKWKDLSRKHEGRAKENFKKVEEYDEWKKSQMSDAERANTELSETRTENENLRRDLALKDAVIKHGLSSDDLYFLRNTPADEVDEAAQKLADRLKATAPVTGKTTKADGKPHEGKPIDVDPKQDAANLEEQIVKARTERNMPLLVALQRKKAELAKNQSQQ